VGSLALVRRRPRVAGALLALSVLVKIYPAVLIGYFTLRRRSVLWWCGIAGLSILAISVLEHGIAPYSNYLTKVVFGRDYPYFGEHNVSLFGMWGRMFMASDYGVAVANLPWLARLLTFGTGAGVLVVCIWASYNRANDSDLGEQLRFGLWLCAMMFLSPSNGFYTFVVMLLPLLTILRYLEEHDNVKIRNWLIVGTALLCWPPAWTDWQPWLYQTLHTGFGLLLLTPSIYGLLIYFCLLAWLSRQRQVSVSYSDY
jgi:hypothetical protein